MKQSFEKIFPQKDGRTKISPLEFAVGLIFFYMGDSKTFALESIRRGMKELFEINLSRGAFWERLSRKRLNNHLREIISELMIQFSSKILIGKDILKKLNILAIYFLDSSSITLPKSAKDKFPGKKSTAGIKWHACFDFFNGMMVWFKTSPSRKHDSNYFPDFDMLKNKLIIFDLGYYDYGLLLAIEKAEGFFLSRLKTNAVVYVEKVVQGLSKKAIGQSLLSLKLASKSDDIIEALIHKVTDEGTLCCRAIGFWNPNEKKYHWYLTNLEAAAYLIYPLYRTRWQIELIFKACKNSLNMNQIPSANKNIIESLLLSSIVAYLSTYTILSNSVILLDELQQRAISYQRVAKVAVNLRRSFITFILDLSADSADLILRKIRLFSDEIFDPNYKRRETSATRIHNLVNQ